MDISQSRRDQDDSKGNRVYSVQKEDRVGNSAGSKRNLGAPGANRRRGRARDTFFFPLK